MITELYTFSPGSYVTAEEWNANFKVLYNTNLEHSEAIVDAGNELAFPNSDLTQIFNAARKRQNSWNFTGDTLNASQIYAGQEYYGNVSTQLNINIPAGMNGEIRILAHLLSDKSVLPFIINYSGTKIVNNYNNNVFRAGYYYIMIYETNGVAQAKIIWTGA